MGLSTQRYDTHQSSCVRLMNILGIIDERYESRKSTLRLQEADDSMPRQWVKLDQRTLIVIMIKNLAHVAGFRFVNGGFQHQYSMQKLDPLVSQNIHSTSRGILYTTCKRRAYQQFGCYL